MKTVLWVAFFLLIVSIATAPAQPASPVPNSSLPFIPPHRDRDISEYGPFDLPAPGQKADLGKIVLQANILMQNHRYEEALQHLVWYYAHSETDPSQVGMRAWFALGEWEELTNYYPKARQALVETRDEYEQRLLDGHGSSDLFLDIDTMNRSLASKDRTYTLFKSIELRDPKLAANCFYYVESQMLQRGEYEDCRKYIGDPNLEFQKIHQRYETGLQGVQQHIEMRQRFNQKQKEEQQAEELFRQQIQAKYSIHITGPPPLPPLLMPDDSGIMKQSAEQQFVGDVRGLVEILVATGDKADAEDIQKQALAVLYDPRLETAVDDVYEKFAQQTNTSRVGQTTSPSSQN